jgi:L-amino acid N-acyltransferase YncA
LWSEAEERRVIRGLREEDWPMVATIYEEGIRTGNATFEAEVPSWEEWDAAHPPHRLVCERDDAVVGWAALSPVSARSWYAGVAENSVYVSARARGQGVGRELLSRRTRPRSRSTSVAASAGSARASAARSWTASGATPS